MYTIKYMNRTNINILWKRHGWRLLSNEIRKCKCMSKFILWPSLRCECYFKSCRQTHGAVLSVSTDTEPEDHGRPVGRRHADLWCDRLLEAGSPSHRLFMSSAVYISVNFWQRLWWPHVFTGMDRWRPSALAFVILAGQTVFLTWARSSLNLDAAKRRAQRTVQYLCGPWHTLPS